MSEWNVEYIFFSLSLFFLHLHEIVERQKMAIFGQAEKSSHTLEPSFSAII